MTFVCKHPAGVRLPDGRFLCFACDDAPADLPAADPSTRPGVDCDRCDARLEGLPALLAHTAAQHPLGAS